MVYIGRGHTVTEEYGRFDRIWQRGEMKRGYWFLLTILIAGGGGIWWWYSSGETAGASEQTFVRRAAVRRGDLVVSITATGRVDPIEQVEVKSKASGEIINLPIEEGDIVKRGDLIARLDPTTAQNDFDQAEADLAVAHATLRQRVRERERVAALVRQDLSPPDDLDQALLAYEQANAQVIRARAALSTTRERLDDTDIRAPIDGVILTRPVEIGQVISSGMSNVTGGTLLCTVANMTQVYVVADVDETDIGKVTADLEAFIVPDAYPDLRLDGSVQRIAPLAKVQQNVTIFEVTTIVDNADFLLKAGMNATVEVIIARSENAILIPTRAVQMRERPRPSGIGEGDSTRGRPAMGRDGDTPGGHGGSGGWAGHGGRTAHGQRGGGPRLRPAVEVIRNGVREWQPIETGLSNFDEVEVLQGLVDGDTVIYNLVSGAMQSRADFRERIRNRSGMGMRRSSR